MKLKKNQNTNTISISRSTATRAPFRFECVSANVHGDNSVVNNDYTSRFSRFNNRRSTAIAFSARPTPSLTAPHESPGVSPLSNVSVFRIFDDNHHDVTIYFLANRPGANTGGNRSQDRQNVRLLRTNTASARRLRVKSISYVTRGDTSAVRA